MEKMPLKWVMNHQLTFVMALLFVLLDLSNEISYCMWVWSYGVWSYVHVSVGVVL